MRPLRSVLIGDCDFYLSEFIFGVAQGMTLLGHWHTSVNVRQPIDTIARRLAVVKPDVIWGHMLLWSPLGRDHTLDLLSLCEQWRSRGARVLIHDGDARMETRFPVPLADAVDLALCNHTVPRTPWAIAQLRWPYFAFVQSEIAEPDATFAYLLAFAGRLGGGIYQARTALVHQLQCRLGATMRLFPDERTPHTLFLTSTLAASATAVLGYGRPALPGWTDVRVFQYPGAGGVLLHDDVQGFLEPDEHYIAYESENVESVLDALARARALGPKIRRAAFAYVQAHHSSRARVRDALAAVNLA